VLINNQSYSAKEGLSAVEYMWMDDILESLPARQSPITPTGTPID
jgi:hypothetical protein